LPLVTVSLRSAWMLPNEREIDWTLVDNPHHLATHHILEALEGAVAGAVNLHSGRGAELIRPVQVWINLVLLHEQSRNAEDFQIYINPGMGRPPLLIRLLLLGAWWRKRRRAASVLNQVLPFATGLLPYNGIMIPVIIATGWLVFWVYWIVAAVRGARSSHPYAPGGNTTWIRYRLVIAVIAISVIWLTHRAGFQGFDYDLTLHNGAVQMAGLVLFVLGVALACWARVVLGRNWGMPMTRRERPGLITTGPYAYVRHPIYTGILVAALGSALGVSLVWLVVFAGCGVYFIVSAVREERFLTQQFPGVYADYRKRTKMLVPFVL